MKRLTFSAVLASSLFFACGLGAGPSAGAVSAAAQASLSEASDPGSCIANLKDQVYAGALTLEAYEARALSDCGIDFNAPADATKGAPSQPEAAVEPTAAEVAYAACANAVKAEVEAGTLAIESYEATIAARCAP